MSWIAITAPSKTWTDPALFAAHLPPRPRLLARGSFVMETRLSPEGASQPLLSYERIHPWPGGVSIQAVSGGLVVVMRQADALYHTALEYKPDARTDILRITFSWDSAAGYARLALERPDSDEVVMRSLPAPPPLLLDDIEAIVMQRGQVAFHPDVVFFAVSDAIEPLGPQASVVPSTPIQTTGGYRALGDLRCGDLVHTRKGDVVPVLQVITREVPAFGSFRPVRLRAPYLGLRQDIVVAAHQRLLIDGTEVEYLFGREAVLVPASALANGFTAVEETGRLTVRYAQVMLPGHEAPLAAGAALESLYVGRLRRRTEKLSETLLSDCPKELLPEHARAGLQVLRPFEAMTLAEARAA